MHPRRSRASSPRCAPSTTTSPSAASSPARPRPASRARSCGASRAAAPSPTTRSRRLLAVATERGHETEAMICLLLLNGLRVSELCAADVENLHREPGGGHSLVVRGKGGKDVDVALNDRTERAVLKTVGARSQGPIFRRQDGRRLRAGTAAPRVPYNRQAVYRLLGELARAGRSRRRGRRPGRRRQPAPPPPHLRHPPARPRRARSPRSRTPPATPRATPRACTTAPAPRGASTRPTSSTSSPPLTCFVRRIAHSAAERFFGSSRGNAPAFVAGGLSRWPGVSRRPGKTQSPGT